MCKAVWGLRGGEVSFCDGDLAPSGKAAPGSDSRIRHRIQIGTLRPIRVNHTNCLQVAIKTHSFIVSAFRGRRREFQFQENRPQSQ